MYPKVCSLGHLTSLWAKLSRGRTRTEKRVSVPVRHTHKTEQGSSVDDWPDGRWSKTNSLFILAMSRQLLLWPSPRSQQGFSICSAPGVSQDKRLDERLVCT